MHPFPPGAAVNSSLFSHVLPAPADLGLCPCRAEMLSRDEDRIIKPDRYVGAAEVAFHRRASGNFGSPEFHQAASDPSPSTRPGVEIVKVQQDTKGGMIIWPRMALWQACGKGSVGYNHLYRQCPRIRKTKHATYQTIPRAGSQRPLSSIKRHGLRRQEKRGVLRSRQVVAIPWSGSYHVAPPVP